MTDVTVMIGFAFSVHLADVTFKGTYISKCVEEATVLELVMSATVGEDPSKYATETDILCPVKERVYHDDLVHLSKQNSISHFAAVVTLGLYTAWPYILCILFLFSFIPLILIFNLFILSTLLLPCPVLWKGFLNWELFKLWRQYFSFSYHLEEVLSCP